MAEPIISAERLRELFHYSSETGVFTRLIRTSNNARVGDVAGCADKYGYLLIRVDGCLFKAHRLAWLYTHGDWPPEQIDHIDNNPSNNRIVNLRLVTNSENMQNHRQARSNNKVGMLGVCWSKSGKNWHAQITVSGKRHHLGYFSTPELAHAAYVVAKRELHPMGML